MCVKYINDLLKDLKEQESCDTIFNQYSGEESIPYHNLNIYLNTVSCFKIKSLFIDLSPGYKDCAVTGIPLTNEFILFNHQSGCPLFNYKYGYKKNLKCNLLPDFSSTLFWTDVNMIDKTPLLWYCYPFHSHLKYDLQSNRSPSQGELLTGMTYLIKILEIFKPERIFALGNTVSEHVNELRIKHIKLFHPFTLSFIIRCRKWYSSN
jgi:hypothetical protein